MLMQKLAADMTDAPRPESRAPERAPQRAPDKVVGNLWDDDSAADRWISESEERDATAWRMQPRKAIAASPPPLPAVVPAKSAQALPDDYPRPARATRLLVPALAGAGLLVLIATVALVRNARSGADDSPAQPDSAEARASDSTSAQPLAAARTPEPIVAAAPAADAPPKTKPARDRELVPSTVPPSSGWLQDSASDRESARRRRPVPHRDVVAPESTSEAETEADDDRPLRAPAASDALAREEAEPAAATEPRLPVASIRPRPAVIAAPPVIEPPVAPKVPVPEVKASPQPRAPASTVPRGVSRAAVLLERTTPQLPARARRSGILEGFVSVAFTIDRTGTVTKAKVVQAEPAGLFDDVALRAIRTWRYQPAQTNGAAVESRQRVTIRFKE